MGKVGSYNAVSTIVGTEEVTLTQGGSTKRATITQIKSNIETDIGLLNIMNGLGSPALVLSPGMIYIGNSSLGLTDNTCFFYSFYVREPIIITGVSMIMNTQGNYTANQYNGIGLYSILGGTLTLVASTADDGNIWKAAGNATITKAFSALYNAVAGVYFLAVLYNSSAQVTAPKLSAGVGGSSVLTGFTLTNSNRINAYLDSQNTLPANFNASTFTGGTSGVLSFIIY